MYNNRRYANKVVPYGRRRTNYLQKKRFPMYRTPSRVSSAAFIKKVRRAAGAELKYLATNSTFLVSVSDPSALFLSNVIQGLGPSQRLGNWINPVGMHGTVRCHGTTLAAAPEIWTMRVGILRFNDDISDTTFISSDLLETASRPGGPFKVSSKGKFSVLWTRVVFVSNNSDNGLFNRSLKFRIDLETAPKILFDGPSLTGQTRNHLVFFAMSDSPSPDDEPPSVDIDCMFRYTDS